ncbi:T9SS type A sorting domain-containing protein [Flavobacterium mekongense]|uniref:T9SS type A sorting domain-containing protein n=1 Tax=Flavobacterium mekongense TaxID=3379707 RepID=UPI00399AC3F0
MIKLLILIFSFAAVSSLSAQSPNDLWTETYGGTRVERAYSVLSTDDGGSIFIASTESSNGDVVGLHGPLGWNYSDFWVVKLNSSGAIQWQKCLGGSRSEVPYEIIQVADGGYVIAGSGVSNDGDLTLHYGSESFLDLWIIKIDNSGNLIWQKTYGGYSTEYACSVDETPDGGLIVAAILNADYNGTVPITYSGSMDYWVLKLNSLGEIQWNNHYGGENRDQAHSIKATPDGGCIVVGQSGSHYGDVLNSIGPFNADIPDYWIAKLSPNGNIEWQKSYGGLQSDWATSVSLTNDGGYIIAGITNSNSVNVTNYHGNGDGWVIKLNASGTLEWQKCIGGSDGDNLSSVIQTIDEGYLLCGSTNSTDGDLAGIMVGNKAWIIKLDSIGNISWQRHYQQQPISNFFNDITQNPDGTVIAIGSLNYYSDTSNYDVFAVKLDVNSLTTTNANHFNVVLYPNAVDDILYIQSGTEIFEEINIYNLQGKKVNSFRAENNRINLSSLQKGVYFVEFINDLNQNIRKKIVKK